MYKRRVFTHTWNSMEDLAFLDFSARGDRVTAEPTCAHCGMSQETWTANDGQGYVLKHRTYCCRSCAESRGCICRSGFPERNLEAWQGVQGLVPHDEDEDDADTSPVTAPPLWHAYDDGGFGGDDERPSLKAERDDAKERDEDEKGDEPDGASTDDPLDEDEPLEPGRRRQPEKLLEPNDELDERFERTQEAEAEEEEGHAGSKKTSEEVEILEANEQPIEAQPPEERPARRRKPRKSTTPQRASSSRRRSSGSCAKSSSTRLGRRRRNAQSRRR